MTMAFGTLLGLIYLDEAVRTFPLNCTSRLSRGILADTMRTRLSNCVVLCGLTGFAFVFSPLALKGQNPPMDHQAAGIASKSSTSAPAGERYALLIGVGKYLAMPELDFTVPDCKLLAQTLIQYGGFEPHRVVVMTDDAPDARRPDAANLRSELRRFLSLPRENDTVVLFFGGHGGAIKVEQEERTCLLPIDASRENLSEMGLRVAEWHALLESCKAREKLLILDIFHAGGKADDSPAMSQAAWSELSDSVMTLLACGPRQHSHEDPGLGRGLFVHFLAEGLRGAADEKMDGNRDGKVDVGEAFRYARNKVTQHTLKTGTLQVPELCGKINERMILTTLDSGPSRGPGFEGWPPPESSGPTTASFPMTAEQARQVQENAARQLGLPKNLSLDIGDGVKMELVLIPAGEFLMGSPNTEAQRGSDEGPQHRVWISAPFYMGKYEVTQAQWRAVMRKNPSTFKGEDNLPVESVSWEDSRKFCRFLSAKVGQTIRLPTEAEWEYACRAGSATKFHFGDSYSELDGYAWHAGNSGKKTHPVGQKKPNAFGLHDLHGNVWEWCEDVWHDNYQGAPTDGSAWTKGGNSARRIVRGGSWEYGPADCRAAYRNGSSPRCHGCGSGLRVVGMIDALGSKR